jgi:hypothetical protein
MLACGLTGVVPGPAQAVNSAAQTTAGKRRVLVIEVSGTVCPAAILSARNEESLREINCSARVVKLGNVRPPCDSAAKQALFLPS